MTTKFILIIWIGVQQTQSISALKFDTEDECEAARAAVSATHYDIRAWNQWPKCVPYTYEVQP